MWLSWGFGKKLGMHSLRYTVSSTSEGFLKLFWTFRYYTMKKGTLLDLHWTFNLPSNGHYEVDLRGSILKKGPPVGGPVVHIDLQTTDLFELVHLLFPEKSFFILNGAIDPPPD